MGKPPLAVGRGFESGERWEGKSVGPEVNGFVRHHDDVDRVRAELDGAICDEGDQRRLLFRGAGRWRGNPRCSSSWGERGESEPAHRGLPLSCFSLRRHCRGVRGAHEDRASCGVVRCLQP